MQSVYQAFSEPATNTGIIFGKYLAAILRCIKPAEHPAYPEAEKSLPSYEVF